MNHYENIMRPIKAGRIELKNRVTFSPTYPWFATYDNHVSNDLIVWASRIAAGGPACVSVGTGVVNPLPPFMHYLVSLSDDSCIIPLNQLFDAIHAYDCKAGFELMPLDPEPEPFDERERKGKPEIEIVPGNYTNEEIKEMIQQYADATERVLKAGGDMVVLHGAHMQPPAAFFSKVYNQRHDEYGCDSLENRARFTVEILEKIREKVGDKLAVEYRISGSDMTEGSPEIDELIEFVMMIQDKIDWLHVSRGQLGVHKLTPYVFPPLYYERGFNLDYAVTFKAALNIPVSCVGGMDIDVAEKAIAEGKIDMVAMSRPFLADQDIVAKIKHRKADEIRPCIRCNTCIHRTHNFFLPVRCAVNAKQGRESLFNPYPVPLSSKKVAVIGGGPAGMEAARTAADRGHKVTLYETLDHLGGMLEIGSKPSFKGDLKKYKDWAVRMTERHNHIRIKLNTEATPGMIKAKGYDAVIIAIGAEPIIPAFAHNDGKKVLWAGDVESGTVETGKTVVVVGAGMTGMETAVELSNRGKKVTLIDMLKVGETGAGGTKMNIIALHNMLAERGVEIVDETKLEAVSEKGIIVRGSTGEKREMTCDTVVLSLGVRAKTDAARAFADCANEVILVGDCNTKRYTIFNAITTAHDAAMSIL